MPPLERCDEVGHLALSLCGQRVKVVPEELSFQRQPPGIEYFLALPRSIAFRPNLHLHGISPRIDHLRTGPGAGRPATPPPFPKKRASPRLADEEQGDRPRRSEQRER